MYLEVSAGGGSGTGTYAYVFQDFGPDDHADSRQDATTFQPAGESFPVVLYPGGDVDVVAFRPTEDHLYRLSCADTDYSVGLKWVDAEGVVVADRETPAVFVTKAGANARWFLEVTGSLSTDVRTLSCRMDDVGLDDHADQNAGATPLTFGVPVSVQGHWLRDMDILSFTAVAGHDYTLTTNKRDLTDIRVDDATGAPLHPTYDPALRYHFTVSGTAFIRIYTGGDRDRPFSVTVQDLGPQ
jgi:hypothetical protein